MRSLDQLARDAAAAARAEAEQLAGPLEQPTFHPSPFDEAAGRPWLALGVAAVAAVAVSAAAVWVAVGTRGVDDSIRGDTPTPVTTVAAPATTTPAPASTLPSGGASTTTSTSMVLDAPPPTVTLAPGQVSPGGQVSYLDPPPTVALAPVATVALTSDLTTAPPPVAVLADGGAAVVDNQRGVIIVAGADGTQRDVPLVGDAAPSTLVEIVIGPDGLLYGVEIGPIGQGRIVAMDLEGDAAGHVQAARDIDTLAGLIEAPPGGVLRAGPTGIVNGLTGEVLIGYPTQQTYGLDILQTGDDAATIVRGDSSIGWAFDIERIATEIDSYTGDAPPAPTADRGGRYWTAIGPYGDTTTDFPRATLPVIAFLNPDGTVTWRSLPDDWHIAASGIAGTLLLRWEADHITLTLANPN